MVARKVKGEFRVVEHAVRGAHAMITIGQDNIAWREKDLVVPLGYHFARVQPPADATDFQIARVRKALTDAGVGVVVVQPRPRAQTVTRQQDARPLHSGIREVIEEMVREANTPDRGALSDLVQREMGKVGL
jgi:hypothetical protein